MIIRTIFDTLQAVNSATAQSLRADANQAIFGGGVPTSLGPQGLTAFEGTTQDQIAIFGRAMASCDRITLTHSGLQWVPSPPSPLPSNHVPGSLNSRMIIGRTAVTPEPSTLVVALCGHKQSWFPYGAQTPEGLRSLMQQFVDDDGADVLLVSMPFMGDNGSTYQTVTGLTEPQHAQHNIFSQLKPPSGSALRFFLEPIIAGINNARWKRRASPPNGFGQSTFEYQNVVVIGLSGGAWAATLLAALDTRITHCYAMGGSLPLCVVNTGRDWEQNIEDLGGLDYHDLYMMGAEPNTRRVGLFYSMFDAVWPGWQMDAIVSNLVSFDPQGMGFGPVNVCVDRASPEHDFTPPMIDFVMSDFAS